MFSPSREEWRGRPSDVPTGRRRANVPVTQPRSFQTLVRVVLAVIVFAICLRSVGTLQAAAPVLDQFFPPAGQLGTTNSIVALGKFDPWPPRIWTDHSGLRAVVSTNKGAFSLEIDATVPAGPHLLRFFNDEGSSRPRTFIIDRQPQIREQEPNDDPLAAQEISTLPALIVGRLEKSGDVDTYAVHLAAGQTLVASIESYVLESPLDAVLRVIDERGVQVAWNHDGRTLDPALAFTANAAGRYRVQVFGFPYPATSEIRFFGNDKCVYRLDLSGGPVALATLPLGVARTGTTPLSWIGWNLPAMEKREFVWHADSLAAAETRAQIRLPGIENTLSVPVGEGPEALETEPNDRPEQANPLDLPGGRTGRIDPAGDEDRYRFTAKKGERFLFSLRSAALGFPVDAWMAIEGTNGVVRERREGGNGSDPEISWTAGGDGEFFLAVGNLLHRGGSNFLYRLTAVHPVPSFKITSAEHSLVVRAGSTNDFKVNVSRQNGFTNAIVVHAVGLPSGVQAASVEVSEKGGDLVLKMVVVPDAAAANVPFTVVATSGTTSQGAVFSFVSTSENNGVPGGYRELLVPETDQFWITVRPAEKKVESATR